MRYNHIPDSVCTNISRGIDRYSSAMFMCNTHLLISKGLYGSIASFLDQWKDSGITGVLCLVTCRKLKSNVIRIYDGDVTKIPEEITL